MTASLVGFGDIADRPTQLTNLAYAGRMIAGILVAVGTTRLLTARSAEAGRQRPA
ncbi:hypothetical protein [Streptomyces resistomycificus]|uniref:hypothetical protein n=1 Tax=Streptomyces resistomycificus TaxID=67356 RepID=UPI000B06A498|nr:hypothetical protein [Streptomyces resistomycificus]